jgi:hypothetical protein
MSTTNCTTATKVNPGTRRIFSKLLLGVFVFLLMSGQQSWGQRTATSGTFENIQNSNARITSTVSDIDWIADQRVNGVSFFHRLTTCNGRTVVFLKFENKTTRPVSVTWTEIFDTQSKKGSEGWKGPKQIMLKPGTTSQADCAGTDNPQCRVVPLDVNPTYVAVIKSFAFANITVTDKP